jgi:hypothetical protein
MRCGDTLRATRRKERTVMVRYYSKMLHASPLGWAVAGGVPGLWPLLATLHFFGMALLIGCVATIDLRMLGIGKGLPLGPMQRLLPWGMLGFGLNLLSGIGLYAGNPGQYQTGPFFFKMLFVVLAGLNALLFYTSGLYRTVNPVGAGQDAPMAAKLSAVVSLLLWFGVMFWGRMLSFLNDTF